MRIAWLTMWSLLLRRAVVTVLLFAVLLVTGLLLLTVQSDKRGIVVAVMSAFSAGGLAAVITERIARYSFAAGSLGLPDHTRVMRRVQTLFLLIFVAVPALIADIVGMEPLPGIALLMTAAAGGIAISTYGALWIILIPILGRVTPLSEWLFLPITQLIALVASALVIYRWSDLPRNCERTGGLAPALLADAAHERDDPLPEEGEQSRSAGAVRNSTTLDKLVERATAGIQIGRDVPSALAFGLGYSVDTVWRGVGRGTAIGIGILIVWHAIRGYRPEVVAYSILSAMCCITLVGRLQGILSRWMRTREEQAILRMTQVWPEAGRVKKAILESTFIVQRGSLTVWAAISMAAWTIGWLDSFSLFVSATALVAVSLAFSGSLWATFARKQVREWQLSSILIVTIVGAGAVTVAFGSLHYQAIGALMMVVPPALALTWYLKAPLRVPMNVSPRALRTPL
jgi:hypothetical protein